MKNAEIIDLAEYKTNAAVLKLFFALKDIMGLRDWDITLRQNLDNGNLGECLADFEAKEAEIFVKPGLSAPELRKVLIHELEHCHTAPIRDVEYIQRLIQRRCGKAIADELTGKIEKELWKREEEIVCRVEETVDGILSTFKNNG